MLATQRPIIGVLIKESVIKRLMRQKINFQCYPRLLHLAIASKEAEVTLYFFSPQNANDIRETIIGTFYDPKDHLWKQKKFLLPDVLYNRGGGRVNRIFLDFLEQKKVIKFNPQSFDKWDVYTKLQNFSEIQGFLPFTKLYQKDQDIIDFLETHNEVYLKGVRGGKGTQIFHVSKLPENRYEYSHCVGKMFIEEVNNTDDLLKRIHEFYKGRQFIIQKPIDLIKLSDSRIDFRAELQRNGLGELTISGVMARIGKSQSPITIHSSAYPVEMFFKEFLNYSDEKIQELTGIIHDFLFTIYKALEKAYGIFGEIGIDFGIDTSGNIWFIEPNAKSAKVSLMKAYDEKTIHQAFLKPLQFARYLYFCKR